jgi:hypothetical protein
MEAFLAANMAPAMFTALIVFLLLGYPVAFSLAAVGLVFGWVGIELGLLTPALLQALPDRVFGIMKNEILLAIPFFTFMGLVLERSGMAEDLLDTIGQRARLRGHPGRRPARRHDGGSGGLRDRDGPDLAADHAAVRLRPVARDRRDRR